MRLGTGHALGDDKACEWLDRYLKDLRQLGPPASAEDSQEGSLSFLLDDREQCLEFKEKALAAAQTFMDFACDDLLEEEVKKGLPRWLPVPEMHHQSFTIKITQKPLSRYTALSDEVVLHLVLAKEECTICQAAYEAEDAVSRVEACFHAFHTDCLENSMATAPEVRSEDGMEETIRCPYCRTPMF